jgi:hypothetical protein
VIRGNDPLSLAYETSTHPSTSYHRELVLPNGNDPLSIDYQSMALPLSYGRNVATLTGFEPVISAVTGQRIRPAMLKCLDVVGDLGVEPSMPKASDLQSGAVTSAARHPIFLLRLRDFQSSPLC